MPKSTKIVRHDGHNEGSLVVRIVEALRSGGVSEIVVRKPEKGPEKGKEAAPKPR